MILGHGVDLVEVARIARSIERHGDRFLERVYTDAERAYAFDSKKRANERLAARFAAKEASLKALGTGWADGIAWTDIEVVSTASGKPELRISGRAAALGKAAGMTAWLLSLTHTDTHAMASVIACGA